ncbi:hypothetical protein FB451DRAFT_1190858 [Mycena latifolia]|nr:hypothetical protein FB451DRAFT_1190858 [Mycena latifolia]
MPRVARLVVCNLFWCAVLTSFKYQILCKDPCKMLMCHRTRKNNTVSSPLVDDEAQESDAEDNPGTEGSMSSCVLPVFLPLIFIRSDPEFINDDELEEDKEYGTPNLTPPPPATHRRDISSYKSKDVSRDDNVIDIESSEEDLEAMDLDDSMYKKPAGLKASALPPSLTTRSSMLRMDEDAMGRFMTKWMERFMQKHMPLSAERLPQAETIVSSTSALLRTDFDKLELEKGIMASKQEARRVRSKACQQSKRVESPPWDTTELDAAREIKYESKGKRKAGSGSLDADLLSVNCAFDDAKDDSELAAKVAARTANEKAQLKNYVVPKSSAVAIAVGDVDPTLTMSQYFKDASVVLKADIEPGTQPEASSDSGDGPSTVFLEDLETYRNYFDPDAPCGVYDPELQDPVLAATYIRLPPLPAGRKVLPAYDPSRYSGRNETDDVKGGRAKFSSWRRHLKTMPAKNCIGAMLFVETSPNFINPSRVSPLRLSRQSTSGSSGSHRLAVDNRLATCVSAVFCAESVVVTAGKIGPKSERMRKWVSGIFHNQDWERFESLMCLVFGEDVMYGQINSKKAISFQTMISPELVVGTKDVDVQFSKSAPADMFSPIVSKSPSKPKSSPSKDSVFKLKTLLAHNDVVPVYDAQKTPFDFDTDLSRISAVLPLFTGEIPFSSFIVVGYSVSSYSATLSGGMERVPHLGCNILWVIVCGTPLLRK